MSRVECALARIPYKTDPTAFEVYEEAIPAVKRITVRNVGRVMVHCRIPFSHVDMNEMLEMFWKHGNFGGTYPPALWS